MEFSVYIGDLPPMPIRLSIEGQLPNLRYCFVRITPTPIVLRSRSGYFRRAFSACCFVLKAFDSGVNSPSTYLKSSHCSVVLGIEIYTGISYMQMELAHRRRVDTGTEGRAGRSKTTRAAWLARARAR